MTDNDFSEDPNPSELDRDASVDAGPADPVDPVDLSSPPSVESAVDEPPLDEPALDEPPLDEPALDEPALDEPAPGDQVPPFAETPPPPLPPVRVLRRTDASSGPGVAGGIARYLGVETGIIKAAFVVAAFFGGLGIFAYIAGWALIPRESHPDPRPVVLNGSLTGLVIGTLALIGAVSVGFGAGGAAGNLLAPALLIGFGFYLLDQRSSPQVITNSPGMRGERPSWIPPLTTTPIPGSSLAAPYTYAPPSGAYDPTFSGDQTPPTWGSVHTDSVATVAPATPRPPVTAVTMAITAATVAALIGLDQFTSINVGVPTMFGVALAIIVTGIIVSLFVGRALGLWFAGFIALIGLAVSPIAVDISVNGVGSTEYTVVDQADLASVYVLGTGELIVDLHDVTFTSDAATSVELKAGSITVYVPEDVTVDLRAHSRFGEIIAPRVTNTGDPSRETDQISGTNSSLDRVYPGREGGPTLTLDVDVRFGAIEIRRG